MSLAKLKAFRARLKAEIAGLEQEIARQNVEHPNGVSYTLQAEDGGVYLCNLRSREKGQGHARAALAELTATADRDGTTISLDAIAGAGGMRQSQLEAFYRRLGFRNVGGSNRMIYQPRETAAETAAAMKIVSTRVLEEVTAKIRAAPAKTFKARYDYSSMNGALIECVKQVKKHNTPYYAFVGNSYMNVVFHVDYRRGMAFDPIANTGTKVLEVSPDLTVTEYTLDRTSRDKPAPKRRGKKETARLTAMREHALLEAHERLLYALLAERLNRDTASNITALDLYEWMLWSNLPEKQFDYAPVKAALLDVLGPTRYEQAQRGSITFLVLQWHYADDQQRRVWLENDPAGLWMKASYAYGPAVPMLEASPELSAAWWDKLSTEEQLRYLRDHPRSRLQPTRQAPETPLSPAPPVAAEPVARRHILGLANGVAAEHGFPLQDIELSDETYNFQVNGRDYVAHGTYNFKSKKIKLYTNHLSATKTPGLMAHEVMHHKWETVYSGYRRERNEVAALAAEHTGSARSNPVMRADDTLKPPYDTQFPLYTAFREFMGGEAWNELYQEDGCSDYSDAYWQGVASETVTPQIAVHETLAELARLQQESDGSYIKRNLRLRNGPWGRFYEAVDSAYKEMRRAGQA